MRIDPGRNAAGQTTPYPVSLFQGKIASMISGDAYDIEECDPILREHRAALSALRENLDRMKKLLGEDINFPRPQVDIGVPHFLEEVPRDGGLQSR